MTQINDSFFLFYFAALFIYITTNSSVIFFFKTSFFSFLKYSVYILFVLKLSGSQKNPIPALERTCSD